MNPLFNPLFSGRIIKHYLTDVNRAWRLSSDQLKQYQDKTLRHVLKYAYRVPLYQKKYREARIQLKDIHTIDHLSRLPLITKNDLIENFPNGVIPHGFNKNNAVVVGTSGSSGRPMSMYKDHGYIFVEALSGYRQLRAYNMSWRKTRITNIGDFSVPTTTDEESLKKVLLGNLSTFFKLDNYQNLYTGEAARTLLKKMDQFKPQLIIGYTSVLLGLAQLKMNNLGLSTNPSIIISSGEVLDDYSRKFIQEAFNAPVYNLYATTEGGTIAFECVKGNMHVNSDFVHVEILDKNGIQVPAGKQGSIVITRLYRGGTPIIRYTGLNDIASVKTDTCDCGMHTPLLKTIEGRKKDAIILPDGRIFPPATIPMPLAETAAAYGTLQIKRFQILQHAIDTLEILVEIDEAQRGQGVSVDILLNEIQKNYQKLTGPNVTVTVKEVEHVKQPEGMLSPPLILSNIDRAGIENALM